MDREDIIRMAREAGMERIVAIGIDGTQTVEIPRFDLLERFAALVAAHEREACARLVYGIRVNGRTLVVKAIRARGEK